MNFLDFLTRNANWLAAGALLTFLSAFGQTFFISLFADRIMTDFGLSDGEWSLIYGLGTMLSAGIMVWAGALTDVYPIRVLGIVILLGLAGSCLAMAFNPFSCGLVVLVLALRFFGQGMASHIAVVAMARWFVATRGRALAICTLGFTAGELIFPIGVAAMLAWVDWRMMWIGAAGIAALGAPILFMLLRHERKPGQSLEETSNAGMQGLQWTRYTTLRHPLFWLLLPALLGPAAFNTAFFFHHIHYAELKGMDHLELVLFFPVYTTFAVLFMLASGWAVDRWGTGAIMPFYQLPMVGAFVCFAFANSDMAIFLGFFLLAATSGSNSTIPNAFWAEFYGTKNLGSIKAMAAAVMVLGSALGPAITGMLIDAGLGLDRQFVGVGVYFLLTTACMWWGITRSRNSVPAYLARRK